MTSAERQKRYRDRHRLTTGERFRRKIRRAVELFGLWLSADEVKETMEAFGMAWALDKFNRAKDGKAWGFEAEDHMGDVELGININGNPGDRLGDEARYQRRREEQERRDAEWDARINAEWEAVLKECDGDTVEAKRHMLPRIFALAA